MCLRPRAAFIAIACALESSCCPLEAEVGAFAPHVLWGSCCMEEK